MAELSEESVVFLRVPPGQIEKALAELHRNPKVKEAEPVLGSYDIAVTGAFRTTEELQTFQSEIERYGFVEEIDAHPGLENWKRPEMPEEPVNRWTLIRAEDPARAMKDLQKMPSAYKIIETSGEYNLLARVGARDPYALRQAVIREIQKVDGVRRTETRTSATKP